MGIHWAPYVNTRPFQLFAWCLICPSVLVKTISTMLLLEKCRLTVQCALLAAFVTSNVGCRVSPLGELTAAESCVRPASLWPRGTCSSFSLVSSAPLCALVFILPHFSSLSPPPLAYLYIFFLCLRAPPWNSLCLFRPHLSNSRLV